MEFNFKQFLIENKLTTGSKLKSLVERDISDEYESFSMDVEEALDELLASGKIDQDTRNRAQDELENDEGYWHGENELNGFDSVIDGILRVINKKLKETEEDNKAIYDKLKNKIVSDEILDHDDLKAEPDYQKLSRSEQHKLHWVLTQAAEMHREGIEPEEDSIQDEPTTKDLKSGSKGTAELAKKQNQLAVLLKHKDELVSKFKSGELTIDQYKEKIGNIPQHIKTLVADIERLENKAAGEGLNEEDNMLIGNPSFGGKTQKVKVGDKAIYGDEEVTITKIDRVKPGSGATQNRIIAQTADGETVSGKPAYFKPIA